ncbi:Ig-like domain-containing protein [Termitidicoccus mucosus]|uniref:rhamnogalacturonan lyase family protein n=1 Tax=Termitidicoccus mucosus TaxID=1184151 RepID=UPI003182F6EE
MNNTKFLSCLLLAASGIIAAISAQTAPFLMENLGRGVVAVPASSSKAFVSWRLLGTDPEGTAFNLYRSTDGGAPVKLNAQPLTAATSFEDTPVDFAKQNTYTVRPVTYGVERTADGSFAMAAGINTSQPYLRIALQRPGSMTMPDNSTCTYEINDCSVGDLDGDGEYEIIVKWYPSNAKDNSQAGYTGNTYLDAYKLDGTRLWRIDLGRNIRSGAHYTQYLVYDFDGDGKAELACKTADGTIDGDGTVIGNAAADYRTTDGYVLSGPEFLTVFDGLTGAALATTQYLPQRDPDNHADNPDATRQNALWGDNYGNRMNRYLAAVAYLDGRRPSIIMCRGYYTRTFLVAWDWRDGQLTQRWLFDSAAPGNGADGKPNSAYAGQGNHNLTVADVDGDGCDEIIYGSMTVNNDGTGLYSTGLGHGDAMHVSKMIPSRPGQQVWVCHEESPYGHSLRDVRTGEILLRLTATGDTGRAGAGHIDARYPGYQVWGAAANVIDASTLTQISANRPAMNFMIWWDGDLQRELLDGTTITKWNGSSASSLFAPSGVHSGNGTKANPALSGDILGDWREELIVAESGDTALRIYTTTAATNHRFTTLMHDRQYRLAIAWQNVAYNQPPHPSYYIGAQMEAPPRPVFATSLPQLLGPAAPVITGITPDSGLSASDAITKTPQITLHGTAQPGATVKIFRLDLPGDGQLGAAVADGVTGAWTFDYTATTLPEGEYPFAATATDGQGRTGLQSAVFSVVIFTAPPPAPVVERVSSGASGLLITGTAIPLGRVTVSMDGAVLGAALVDAAGVWSFPYAATVTPASHNFTATVEDIAGNPGAGASATETVDTAITTPAITGITPDTATAGDFITSAGVITLQGTAGASASVTISLAGTGDIGTVMADAAGAWSLPYPAAGTLADGEYVFAAVTASGPAKSPSSLPVAVKIDTAPPTVLAVTRHNPLSETVQAGALVFKVAFSEPVSGLQASSFSPVPSAGDLAVTSFTHQVTPDDASIVLVSTNVTGEGRLALNINKAGLTDIAGNAMAADFTASETYTRSLRGDGTWTNPAGGNWGDFDNWENTVMAEGPSKTAKFDTLDITGETVVTLDAARTITNLNFADADAGTAGSWRIAPKSGVPVALTLVTGLAAPVVTVDADTVIAAPLAGTVGFNKSGTAALTLSGSSPLSGAISVNAGTLAVTTGGYYGSLGTLTVQTEKAFVLDGGYARPSSVSITGATPRFTVKSGTLSSGAFTSDNNGNGLAVRFEGGLVSLSSITIQRSTDGNITNFDRGIVITGGTTTVSGAVSLGTGASNALMSVEGGQLTVSGVLTIANLNTNSNRGGALRVTGGRFVSTNTASGIVMNARPGASAGNTSYLNFLGGVSQVEKITLGASASVTSGTTFVNIDGGTLFLGSGGIVKNGGAALVTSVNFTSGVLGAKATWSSSVPMTLSGDIELRADDEAGAARNITLNGVLSGAGGFTKAGSGTLALAAANTFTGPVAVSEGALNVNGSLAAATAAVTVASGATLSGSGTINRPVILHAGATLVLDTSAPPALAIGQTLAKTGAGRINVTVAGGLPATAGTYTLATIGATTLADADFARLSDVAAVQVVSARLELVVRTPADALTAAIAAAQTFLADISIGNGDGQYPQAVIDALTAAIVTAQQGGDTPALLASLQAATDTAADSRIAVDFTALDEMLDDANALLAAASVGPGDGQYPQSALDTLDTAISTVTSVRTKQHVTQAELDVALTALQNAMEAFEDAVISVDFTALLDAIGEAGALHSGALAGEGHGQHSQTDIDSLATAIADAEAVVVTLAVTIARCDDGVHGGCLRTRRCRALLPVGQGGHPQAAIDVFADARDTAQAVSGQAGITPVGVNTALGALQNAGAAFAAARVTVDFSALQTAIAGAASLHARASAGSGHGQHAQADIDALADAIDAALNAAAAPAPTQAAITAALDTLQTAVEAFETAALVVDFSALNAGIADADALLADAVVGTAEGQYPQAAVDALDAVIGTVKAVAGKTGVTQTETATALRMLQNAVDAFESAKITAADVSPPRITRHPVAQSIQPGGTASFSVNATGNGLRYQWQKDGVDIAGATSDALFVVYAKSSDAGVYRVIVSNDHGAATSYEARLSLEEKPSGGGGGAPTWWLLALSAALLALRGLAGRRHL